MIEKSSLETKTLADPKMPILSSKVSQHLSTNAGEKQKTETKPKPKIERRRTRKRKGGEREEKLFAASLLMMEDEMGDNFKRTADQTPPQFVFFFSSYFCSFVFPTNNFHQFPRGNSTRLQTLLLLQNPLSL